MGPINIEFGWYRDAKGYSLAQQAPSDGTFSSLLPEKRFPQRAATSHPGDGDDRDPSTRFPEGLAVPLPDEPSGPWYIVGNGGTLVPYRADESLDSIFLELLNTEPTAEGVLGFVNRWGLLIGEPELGIEAERVRNGIRMILVMNQFIDALMDPEKATRSRFLERIMGVDGFGIGAFGVGEVQVHLIFDRRSGSARTMLTVKNLLTALWLRMAEVLTSDTVMRRCAHCNALFTAGPGTDRRLDARFCSDMHRVLYHRQKNTSVEDQPRRRGRPRKSAA